MAAPTNEELRILEKFRHNLIRDVKLEGVLGTDLGLLQWLRARDLKLDEAEEMLRKSLKWRVDNNMDAILIWKYPPVFDTICPLELCGFDRDNCPVLFLPFGTFDSKRIVNLGHREDYVKYVMQAFEKLRIKMHDKFHPSGQPVTQWVILADMKGLSLQTLACIGAINMHMDALRCMEANYPETVKKIIIVNASRIFSAFFNLVKPMLSQRTFGKIDIFSPNVESWMPALLEFVTMGQLPKQIINQWRLNRRGSSISPPPPSSLPNNLITTSVDAGHKFPIDLEVNTPKSVLSWFFMTIDYDIGFSMSLFINLVEDEVFVPYGVVRSHLEPQAGVIVCEKAGTYKFLFDNSGSVMRAKTLKYRIDMETPET